MSKGRQQGGSVIWGQGLALSVTPYPLTCSTDGISEAGRRTTDTEPAVTRGIRLFKHFESSAGRRGVDRIRFLPSALNVEVKKFQRPVGAALSPTALHSLTPVIAVEYQL